MLHVLLLLPHSSYKADAFLTACARAGVGLTVGTDHVPVLRHARHCTLTLSFLDTASDAEQIKSYARRHAIDAVVAADGMAVPLAAVACASLGLSYNSPASVQLASDKCLTRQAQANAGLPCPRFALLKDDTEKLPPAIGYPCVLKPLRLSASRGVIRVDNHTDFNAARTRIASLLKTSKLKISNAGSEILAESYLEGQEFSIDGLLTNGRLHCLTIFEKPDPLQGPFFEESIFITPPRCSGEFCQKLINAVQDTVDALGLTQGPVHAELRASAQAVTVLEIAPRPIGGLCSNAITVSGMPLEEVIIRHALDADFLPAAQQHEHRGVMMIPIPGAGILKSVSGLEPARRTQHVLGVTLCIALGEQLVPLPEGDRYLGFIFAAAPRFEQAEAALRNAHAKLRFNIAG
ncbi:MAG: ATP-grasp domain-containing protein [Gammaproteobacteria bacterium]|nr:ATP-grasp domain-containing protein [Gammaproteobacteria bacterium]